VAEVEAALVAHCPVKQAAVVTAPDRGGDARLEAYVVPAEHATLTAASLRASLSEVLPAHMVPAQFITVAALPLTPGGKVDRSALPARPPDASTTAASYAKPHSPLERQIVEIWEDLLEARPIGVRHDFFDLGGIRCWRSG
jgi:hypothetical protein